jgi:hypothetical protein
LTEFGDIIEALLAESGRGLLKLSLIRMFWFLSYPVMFPIYENCDVYALLALLFYEFLKGGFPLILLFFF